MSAVELADRAVEAIESEKYDLIVLNFANPDMVGHTGSLPAAIKAVETVDGCLGRIVAAIGKVGGALLVTADHGNCEVMRDPVTGQPTDSFLGAVGVAIDGDELTEVGRATHTDDAAADTWPVIRRSVVVGDRLFTVSPAGIEAGSLTDLTEASFVAFG